jgi:hypothetical protein
LKWCADISVTGFRLLSVFFNAGEQVSPDSWIIK